MKGVDELAEGEEEPIFRSRKVTGNSSVIISSHSSQFLRISRWAVPLRPLPAFPACDGGRPWSSRLVGWLINAQEPERCVCLCVCDCTCTCKCSVWLCECTPIWMVFVCVCLCVVPPTPPLLHTPEAWSRLQGLVQERSWDHGGRTAGICPQEAAPAPHSWHWGLHEPGNGTLPQLNTLLTHTALQPSYPHHKADWLFSEYYNHYSITK